MLGQYPETELKGQSITTDFLASLIIILFAFGFFLSYFNSLESDYSQSDSQGLLLLADIEKASQFILSRDERGLLCENYNICDEKLNNFSETCNTNYTRISTDWGIASKLKITLYNSTYTRCLCNCNTTISTKLSLAQTIAVPYNNSLFYIDLISTIPMN